MSTIDKIVALLADSGKTQKELTDYLGITPNAFTDWKSGRIKSYRKHISQIAKFFNVSSDYLLNDSINDTPAYNPEVKIHNINIDASELSPTAIEFIDKFLSLSQADQETFVSLVNKMSIGADN